jgi:hypothetical protein
VPPEDHLLPAEEKLRYSHHDNQATNAEYRNYLLGVSQEIDRIPVSDPMILDFGSGPDYVLTRVLREKGKQCVAYDPVYGLGMENLDRSYDIVILCETIEHVRDLHAEAHLLRRISKPVGYVLIRTQLYKNEKAVLDWWYAIDETHINFLNERSCAYLAKLLGKENFYSNNKDMVILGPQPNTEQRQYHRVTVAS